MVHLAFAILNIAFVILSYVLTGTFIVVIFTVLIVGGLVLAIVGPGLIITFPFFGFPIFIFVLLMDVAAVPFVKHIMDTLVAKKKNDDDIFYNDERFESENAKWVMALLFGLLRRIVLALFSVAAISRLAPFDMGHDAIVTPTAGLIALIILDLLTFSRLYALCLLYTSPSPRDRG